MDTSSLFPSAVDAFWALVNKRSTPFPITDEPVDVPGGSPYDAVLVERPKAGTISISGTPAGGGGSYTVQTTPPLASGEVMVNYIEGRLTFHSSDAGGSALITYEGLGSVLVTEWLLKVFNSIVATQTALGAGVVPTGYASLKDYLDAEIGGLLAEATDPTTKTFIINGGACFIDRNVRVTIATDTYDLASAGDYQFPSTTLNYYRRALFTIDSGGTVKVYWSDEAATTGALVNPTRPLDEFPVCMVTCRNDNTSTAAGKVNVIAAADIIDLRHEMNLEWSAEQFGLILMETPVKSTSLHLHGGSFLRQPATGAPARRSVSDQDLDFGTGGGLETTAITANHWNALLVTVDATGTIQMYEGTSAATKNAVTLPVVPQHDELPIALVYFQDDGSAGAGTILPIDQDDVYNLFATRAIYEEATATTPDLTLADIDDLRTHEAATPDSTVVIEAGTTRPYTGSESVAFGGGTIDFSTGTHQKTIAGANWLPVVLALDRDGVTVRSYDGAPAASKGASVPPRFPNHVIPLALVYIQGDGSGAAGATEPIVDADIVDMRETVQAGGRWNAYRDGLAVYSDRILSTTVRVAPGFAMFDNNVLAELTSETTLDIAAAMTIALGANRYKYVLLCLEEDGTLSIVEPAGTGAVLVADAPFPALSTVHRNLALILVQDDGSGGTGTILEIQETAIFNLNEPVRGRMHVETWTSITANSNVVVTHNLGRLPHGVSVFYQSAGSGGVDGASDISLVPGIPMVGAGCSIIEINDTDLTLRVGSYLTAYYDASGVLQKPTTGYYRVVVW